MSLFKYSAHFEDSAFMCCSAISQSFIYTYLCCMFGFTICFYYGIFLTILGNVSLNLCTFGIRTLKLMLSGLFSVVLHRCANSRSKKTELSSSICLFMNEGWPLSGQERVTEARLLLRPFGLNT